MKTTSETTSRGFNWAIRCVVAAGVCLGLSPAAPLLAVAGCLFACGGVAACFVRD